MKKDITRVLKLISKLPKKRFILHTRRLEEVIELARAELLGQLHQADYNLNDARVVQTSRNLDRLLNLYRFCNKKPK